MFGIVSVSVFSTSIRSCESLASFCSSGKLASVSVKEPGFGPLQDAEAAARVNDTNWEPRRGNARANRRRPCLLADGNERP